jgi:cysteine synthase B
VYHENELDRKVPVPTDDAYDFVYALGSRGLVVGQSSGAALFAARQVAREIDEGVVVTIFPDFGDRYLSTTLWGGWVDWQRRQREAQSGRSPR